jgi:ribonucrease Y
MEIVVSIITAGLLTLLGVLGIIFWEKGHRTAFPDNTLRVDNGEYTVIKDQEIRNEKIRLLDLQDEYIERLASIAGITKEQARDELFEELRLKITPDLKLWSYKFIQSIKHNASQEAINYIASAIERVDTPTINEFTVTTVNLENDQIKGNLIGKDGRNIQYFEKLTGCELVIDETPFIVTISGFNSVRRHVAKKTLLKLLQISKIHPGTIQEAFKKSEMEVDQDIYNHGLLAIQDLGITDFSEELIRLIGVLNYRSSYGQNVLNHSIQMAKLAKIIATDMNVYFGRENPLIDVDICLKAALLHDIGKAVDETPGDRKNHVILGMEVCDRFGLDNRIKRCVGYQNNPFENNEKSILEAFIVAATDKISASRIGARKQEQIEFYQRLARYEEIVCSVPGVNKVWIMKGGKEMWVFFDTRNVTSDMTIDLMSQIVQRLKEIGRVVGELRVVGKWEQEIIQYLG